MSPAPLVLLPLLCGLAAGQQVPPDVPAEAPPAAAAPEAPGTPVAPVPANPVEPAPAGRVLDAIPWQRSLDDALALSRQTGKPMLLCVNMDGEPASERLANHRYKDPGFIALTAGFIPLIVSPDRHNSRDHDDEGRRIPDARFGRVVDGEHIALEPLLYELYFRGTRVAPRHVGVSPEGEILFDLYLLDNLAHIDRRLAEHGRFDTALPDPTTLDLSGLLRSPDAAARELLETHYASADRETRTALVTASLLLRSSE